MKKPSPRTKFASKQDERDHVLNGLCWMTAENGPPPGYSIGKWADVLKGAYHRGEVVIERRNDEVRLSPACVVSQPSSLDEFIKDCKAHIDSGEPDVRMQCVKEAGELELYVIADGVCIAKRGQPDTRHARTWVSLEPGWVVRDVGNYNGIQIEYRGVAVQ
jgi:hypothetical protein